MMKNLKIVLGALAIVFAISTVSLAQSTGKSDPKQDKKALKKELKRYKKMKPIAIRKMDLDYKEEIVDLKTEIERLKVANKKIDSLQRALNESNNKMRMMEADIEAAKKESSNAKQAVFTGYYFRVQLGAYQNFDIKGKMKNDDNMKAENAGGLDKYTVGYFKNYNDAQEFSKDVRKMGIKDAWVVAYKDGNRINVNEAKAATE